MLTHEIIISPLGKPSEPGILLAPFGREGTSNKGQVPALLAERSWQGSHIKMQLRKSQRTPTCAQSDQTLQYGSQSGRKLDPYPNVKSLCMCLLLSFPISTPGYLMVFLRSPSSSLPRLKVSFSLEPLLSTQKDTFDPEGTFSYVCCPSTGWDRN